jgi:hypothetical protein
MSLTSRACVMAKHRGMRSLNEACHVPCQPPVNPHRCIPAIAPTQPRPTVFVIEEGTRRDTMTEKERLMHTLFDHAERREHINIKFFRGTSDNVSPEQLCHQARLGIEQITSKLVASIDPSETVDAGYQQRSLCEIVAAL